METQNSNQSPAAATEEAPATKNGGNATQEVTSTTQAVEPTKRSLRVDTWKKLRDNKFGVRFIAIFNRIPGFVDSDKAGELLAETEEFKKASNIKVLIDRPLYAAKLQTLLAGKNLYLPSTRASKALYLKVDVPADATEAQMTEILNVQNIEKHRIEISLENKVDLDMVIIGSVVVSRDGYRIGRGNGFNDLAIGLLCEIGSITDKTVIATMVHDSQVVDNLPTNLFQKYDTPVDLIITPTQVIRVAKRLPRPAGIFWELLSQRRLKIIPVLEELKEAQEKAGKVIVLKEEDTDVEESVRNNNRRRFTRRRFGFRRYQRRNVSQNNADQQHGGDNHGQQQRRNGPQRRRFINRRRRPNQSEGDQSGVASKSQERKPVGDGGNRRQRPRRSRMTRDFSVKLSNITRDVRVRDIKSELRSRQCNPMAITWKGQYGRCYLHFGHRNGPPSTEEDMHRVLQALNDLTLTITPNSYKNKSIAGGTNDSNGEVAAGDVVVGESAAGDGAQQQEQTIEDAAATKPSKVISLKVELIKRNDKTNNDAQQATAGAGGALNGGGDPATGGEASSARIESVDTTTV